MKHITFLSVFILHLQVYADDVSLNRSNDRMLLGRMTRAVAVYVRNEGHLPPLSNVELVSEMVSKGFTATFPSTNLDSSGRIVSADGIPFVFMGSDEGWFFVGLLDTNNETFIDHKIVWFDLNTNENEFFMKTFE